MRTVRVLAAGMLVVLISAIRAAPAVAVPEGRVTWAVHVSLVPSWFDPAEMIQGTVFMLLDAVHDAMVKPIPGKLLAPGLAESWTVSPDGLVYEFVLREGAKFHNGEPLTSEDVKFSFERYRGIFSKPLKARVALVETPEARRVRFRLKEPWPDFMSIYGARATGAGWVVPKKYVEQVGEDGFKKAPVGAGPYRFVSFTPGVEVVLEAFDQYWRKTPHVKRLVLRVIPDPATRLVALKRGEVDIAYLIGGELGEELRRTSGLTMKPTYPTTHFLIFPDQWDPKSPWHDQRVRVAANLAMDREALNQAQTFGLSRSTGSIVLPSAEFFWRAPVYPHDLARARRLLTEAGYPNGFDAGDLFTDLQGTPFAEALLTDLAAVGIRLRLRPLERAAFYKSFSEKKLKNLIYVFSADFGNSAARKLEAFAVSGGTYAYGGYPDLNGLFGEQAAERDPTRRDTILQRLQQLVHERAMFAPIWEFAFLHGVGPRVEESGLGLIAGAGFSTPYEDIRLKGK